MNIRHISKTQIWSRAQIWSNAKTPASAGAARARIARTAMAAAALGLVAACTTVTPYQASTGGVGYTDQELDNGRFRITFEGNSQTELATVENYVLYRAAEVTLREGGDHFVVLDSNTEAMRRFVTNGTVFDSGFGRHGFFYGPGYFGGFGGGFGTTTATTRERRSYTVGAVVEVRQGDKPRGDASAYDARQIIDNLNPALIRPGS